MEKEERCINLFHWLHYRRMIENLLIKAGDIASPAFGIAAIFINLTVPPRIFLSKGLEAYHPILTMPQDSY